MKFRLFAAILMGVALLAAPALGATRVTVNGVPISDTDIAARVKLLQLEGGGNTKKATESLIEEQLQLQEAARLGVSITEAQINDAMAQVARNVKLTPSKLTQLLRSRGIPDSTMRARLEAALAWQKVAAIAVQPRVQVSDLELEKAAEAKLDSGSSFDYILKEVLFVTGPAGSASSRTAQANRYRQSFKGCDSAVQLSLSYTDAAVRDLGRRHATQLPDALANELARLNVGGITKPRVAENGVSMLAICEKNEARDTTFLKNKLRNERGGEAMKKEAEKYLAELRQKARINYN
ncbi:peptidylprolyl isomerase [Devosia sp.]|uniref:peptidylprolyl isomerase n=1 Tax=Devosia sp. TaxID=1871048 RepID=UPI003A95C09A